MFLFLLVLSVLFLLFLLIAVFLDIVVVVTAVVSSSVLIVTVVTHGFWRRIPVLLNYIIVLLFSSNS